MRAKASATAQKPHDCLLDGKVVGQSFRVGRQEWIAYVPGLGCISIRRSRRSAVSAVMRHAQKAKT